MKEKQREAVAAAIKDANRTLEQKSDGKEKMHVISLTVGLSRYDEEEDDMVPVEGTWTVNADA